MHYRDLEERIQQLARAASDGARRRFANETIRLLLGAAGPAIEAELSSGERSALRSILADVDNRPPEELAAELDAMHESMIADDVRAIEFDGDLTDLISALDAYIQYRHQGDPRHIAEVAIVGVNNIDYHLGGDSGEYSVGNMLGAPEMAAEFARIQRVLVTE